MLLTTGRSHTCGELRASHIGEQVILMGWVHNRRDHGGAIFIDLRDRYGITQVVFRPDVQAQAHDLASSLRSEFCIAIQGRVDSRGENINPKLPSGEIEISAQQLEIFSKSETPPFEIEDESETREAIRLKYRYLDLRRPALQRNFMVRSQVCQIIRSHMNDQRFLEIETPFLIRHTPGGARNFIVPSRLNRHQFYALAESPQLYKQLFMVSGLDRYYQIVRCFRDEDLRGDRQPEFTQLDVEIAFAREELVYELMEGLMTRIYSEVKGITLTKPFPRMTYREAMARYGSDKPDLRYDLELTDLTELINNCGFRVFDAAVQTKGIVKTLRLPNAAEKLSRKDLDGLPDLVKPVGAKGVAYARIQPDMTWQAPFAKMISAELQSQINQRAKAAPGDVLLFMADSASIANNALSLLRHHMAEKFGLIDKNKVSALWVTEFPLFDRSEDGRNWVACHHPFTSPHPDDVDKITTDARGSARARAYDLVINGVEIAGGSIRIHQAELQSHVFTALGLSAEDAQSKFGFLLEAFRYGPPPHGGIAMGLDRLIMILCGAESLREVIAFPKTQKGTCAMTNAPAGVDEAQLQELHIQLRA